MKKIKILILFLVFFIALFFILDTNGILITTFSDGNSTLNLTFTGSQNITKNLSIPKYSSVQSAFMNLSGYTFLMYNDSNLLQNDLNGSYINITDKTIQRLIVDLDSVSGGNCGGSICSGVCTGYLEYIQINGNDICGRGDCSATYGQGDCAIGNFSLNYAYVNNGLNNITIHQSVGCCHASNRKFDMVKLENINDYLLNQSYPSNVSVSINNTQVWNFTGSFNQTNNKTSNFASTLNTAINNGKCDCVGCELIGTNCNLNFTFSSQTAGILQYSDIQINYDPKPFVYLISPENATYSSSTKNFTCNSTDEINLKNITLYIWNSTSVYNNSNSVNISGTSNSTTFNEINFSRSDNYTWNCLAYNNGSYLNWYDSNYTLIVDISSPIITLNYPTNNAWLNNGTNVDFNCTTEGSNLDSQFLYGNFTGSFILNQTKLSITSRVTNNFKLNLSDNQYSWTCAANKSTDSTIVFSQYGNYTLGIDTIYPNVQITTANETTSNSLALTINFNISDLNINSCFFTLRNSSGSVHNYAENTSFTCSDTSKSISTLSYGTYTFQIFGKDKANNENSSIITFIVQASITTGGGGGSEVPKIPVISLQDINLTKKYDDLQRAIIYAMINSFCSNKVRGETLAIADYSDTCNLNSNDLSTILNKISQDFSIQISLEDMGKFYNKYKDRQVFQFYATENEIEIYDLYTSVLGLTTLLQLNPPSISQPIFAFTSLGNYTHIFRIASNKPIKECEVLSDNVDVLSCESKNSTIIITYNIPNTNFFNKMFNGLVNVRTDAPQNQLESKRIPINFNLYNFSYRTNFFGLPILVFYPSIVIIIFIVIILGYRRFSKKRKAKILGALKI